MGEGCPACGYDGDAPWFCDEHLAMAIQAARAELDPCHCGQHPGPHRHA